MDRRYSLKLFISDLAVTAAEQKMANPAKQVPGVQKLSPIFLPNSCWMNRRWQAGLIESIEVGSCEPIESAKIEW